MCGLRWLDSNTDNANECGQGGPFLFHQTSRAGDLAHSPLVNLNLDAGQVHAASLAGEQVEDHEHNLVGRLESLARHARSKRLNSAAALLQATAENLRDAMLSAKATS